MTLKKETRAFLALEIPEAIKELIAEHQRRLRANLPKARWVRIEGQHLTLRFLGETTSDVLGSLTRDLAPKLKVLPAVAVSLVGAGFFPNSRRPRVAWIGGSADGVEPVVETVESVVSRHGFSRERRGWSLHLTQARLREPWPPEAVNSFLEWGRGLHFESFVCSEVVLFESTLKPDGAVYTALERMPLT
jgi:2'-5' RNA ligase